MFTIHVIICYLQLGGIIVVAVGVWTLVDKSFIEDLLRNNLYTDAAYILLFSGCLSILLSIFGCYGAKKEVKCLLLTYSTLLFILSVVLLMGGALSYVFREQVHSNMMAEMNHDVKNYNPNNPEDKVTKAWDLTQMEVLLKFMAHFLPVGSILLGM